MIESGDEVEYSSHPFSRLHNGLPRKALRPAMNLYSPLVGCLVTLMLIAAMLFSKIGAKIADIPNERSLHSTAVPRIGGIGLMAGAAAGWLLLDTPAWWILLPLLILFCISLLDDMGGLPVKWRFLAHFIAAALMVAGSGIYAQQGIFAALLLLLFTVWMTNLYNFMDGSDGLAGGMALFGFGCYGMAAWLSGNEGFALLNFCIAGAALGFLLFNFHPAKVFMGDAGSIPLGFLAATLGIHGWQSGFWPLWFPLMVFSPFIVDATFTLFQRMMRGEKLSQAHRSHYYQRLVQMGWGHRNTAQAEYALMALMGAGALSALALPASGQYAMLLLAAALYLAIAAKIDRLWHKHRSGSGGTHA
jgi:UDP-N-acetylmuramyl pentapeptide phosphotransferase/UDP-N-acetylglucosamine-1-phosphate transferase